VGSFGKCGFHAHVADGGGSNWGKINSRQRMGLPTNMNFPVDLMTPCPKEFSFSLKLLKGFASSNNNYQTTDYFGSSALINGTIPH
jgi:hypothetical protein